MTSSNISNKNDGSGGASLLTLPLPQMPESFSTSVRSEVGFTQPNRFKKWVHFSVVKKKKSLFSRTKYFPKILVYHVTNRFDLYDDFDSVGGAATDQYSLNGGSYTILKEDNFKILVEAFVGDSQTNVKLKIKFLNGFDFHELLRYFRFSQVLCKQQKKGKKKVNDQKKKEKEEELEGENNEEDEEEGISTKYAKMKTVGFDSKLDVRNWGMEQVLQWTKDYILSPSFDSTFYDLAHPYIVQTGLTGPDLMSKWVTLKEVKSLFLKNFPTLKPRDKRMISGDIVSIAETGFYDSSRNKITKKIIRMLQQRGGSNVAVKPIYVMRLRKVFGRTTLIKKQLLGEMYKSEILKRKRKTFPLKVNVVENLQSDKNKRYRKALGYLLELKEEFQTKKRKKKEMKRVLSHEGEDLSSSNDNSVSTTSSHSGTEFGIFHVSLSIGNLQLDWVDSELVLIRPACSEKAILSCDVGNIVVEDGETFCQNLAEKIFEWNVHFKYNNMKASINGGNCQHFIQVVLEYLNVPWTLTKGVKRFLKSMKYSGVCEKVFKFDKKFSDTIFPKKKEFKSMEEEEEEKKNSIYRKTRTFKPQSHQELDVFVQNCFRKCPTFERDFNDEYFLLKSFDRAFWLQFRNEMRKGGAEEGKRIRTDSTDEAFLKKIEALKPSPRNVHDEGERVNWRLNGCPFTPPHPDKQKKFNN